MDKFLCYVYPPDPDDDYDYGGGDPVIFPSQPLNVPPDRDNLLTWNLEGESYIICEGDVDVPPEGGYYWLELGTDTDHEGYIDSIWVKAMQPASPNEVHEALCTRIAQEIHEEELRLKVGCDCLVAESWLDREPQCHNAKRSAFSSPQGCTRKAGQICLDGDWSPNEMATWQWPKNHFLDGTGVCRWAGQPYDEDFAGHELHPTPQEIVDRWEDDTLPPWAGKGPCPTLDEVTVAWKVAFDRAHEKGDLGFTVLIVPTDDRPTQWVDVAPQAHNREVACNLCTGLPLYDDDCPFYNERPLKKDELILPIVSGHRSATWSFQVRKMSDQTDRRRWSTTYEAGTPALCTIEGIPVMGLEFPSRRYVPMWDRDLVKARDAVHGLKQQWERLRAVSELTGPIIVDMPRWGKTIDHVLHSIWRDMLLKDQWLIKEIKGASYFNVLDVFPWQVDEWQEPNWGSIAQHCLYEQIWKKTLFAGLSPDYPYGPTLFPAQVNDPWLRWAYGLVGAPADLGQQGWEYRWKFKSPQGDQDYQDYSEAEGRRLTKKAHERLKATWYARYDRSRF